MATVKTAQLKEMIRKQKEQHRLELLTDATTDEMHEKAE